MPFRNIQIDPETLPQIQDIVYTPLHKSYRTVSLLGNLIFWVILTTVFSSVLIFNLEDLINLFGHPFYTIHNVVLGMYLLLVLFSFIVVWFGFSRKGYAIREKDITFRSGLFWKTITIIPFNRVQHAEVKQGPIERLFSISQLNVFTAGGSASDLRIPGLTMKEAESLKRYIVNKVSMDEEE